MPAVAIPLIILLALAGVVGVVDVLFLDGSLGVDLSRFLRR